MIYDKLYDWQRQIVDTLATKRAFGLWLDCGLGKTVQALALAERNGARKILIVTPNCKASESVKTPGSWQQWALKLGTDWTVRSKGDRKPMTSRTSASPDCETVVETAQKSGVDDSNKNGADLNIYANDSKSGTETKKVGKAQVAISSSEIVQNAQIPKAFAGITEYEKTVMVINYESLFVHGNKSSRPVLKPEILSFIQSCRQQPVTLLIDESHYIKDPSSQQTVALTAIKRELMCMSNNFHCYLLTGTPFTRGFIDVWNQLKFMGCPMTKGEFRDRFCVLGNIRGLLGWQQPIVGYKNVDELYGVIHKYAVTLKSADVLHLPEQVFSEHISRPTPWFAIMTRQKLPLKRVAELNELRKNFGMPSMEENHFERLIEVWCEEHDADPMSYDEAVKKNISSQNPWFRNIDFPETRYLCDTPGSMWMRSRQLSIGFVGNSEEATWYGNDRIEQIKQLLEDQPDNYVLFYNYVPEFTELFEMCYTLGYNIDVYNGEIKSLTNYERFVNESAEDRTNDRKNIIISNFASGSTGMNWQAYSQCIIASLPTYKHWAQGLKRVHRNGSESTVVYHVFRSSSWLDEDMWKALMSNEEYSDDMFNKRLNEVQV